MMARLAIASVLLLAATTANAQQGPCARPCPAAAAGANGTQPFLFDGRMRGDGLGQRAPADNHPAAGTIIAQPKAGQPAQGR